LTIDDRLFSGPNPGTDEFIEHPCRNAARRAVRELNVHLIPLTTGRT
jgi:hypothetical protein